MFVLFSCIVSTPLLVLVVSRHGNLSIFHKTAETVPTVLRLARITTSMPEIVTKTPKAFGYTNVNRTKPHSVPTRRWRTVSHTSSGRHRDVDRIRAYADLAITGRAASNASSSGAVLGQDIDKPEVMVSGSGLRSKLNSKTVKQKPNGYKYTRGKTATTQVRASPVTVSVVDTPSFIQLFSTCGHDRKNNSVDCLSKAGIQKLQHDIISFQKDSSEQIGHAHEAFEH